MLTAYMKLLWLKMRSDPVLLILLIVAGAYFILYYITDPVRAHGAGTGWYTFYDQGQYLRLAHTLASFNISELYTTYSYGLGYPVVAVPAIWLGFSRDPFVFFNFAAFVFTIYAVYKVAKTLVSPFAGFVAGFGLLFATPLVHYVDQPWNSTVCLVVMSTILLTLTMKKPTKWHALMLGLMVGWAFSARYIDVIFLGILALASLYRGSFRGIVKPATYLAIGTIIITIPVLFSHYKVFGSPFRTPYVNHLGIGGVGGSDQGLQAYSLRRVPRAAFALFVSPRLAGSPDGDRGLLINYFWALAAIPGAVILLRKKNNRVFFGTLVGVGFVASLFYLSFRASTPDSLKYGWLHYMKMFWPCIALVAAAYANQLFQKLKSTKPEARTKLKT